MDDFPELISVLDRLKRNETMMSEEQKKQYEKPLEALRRRATSLSLKIGRAYIFSGIQLAKGDEHVWERIRAYVPDNEIADAERAALTVLFSSYNINGFLTALLPVKYKAFYLGYGPYWAKHCKPITDSDGNEEFTYYNDIIDMFWDADKNEWKRKGGQSAMIMLPPTMELIKHEYATEVAELEDQNE